MAIKSVIQDLISEVFDIVSHTSYDDVVSNIPSVSEIKNIASTLQNTGAFYTSTMYETVNLITETVKNVFDSIDMSSINSSDEFFGNYNRGKYSTISGKNILKGQLFTKLINDTNEIIKEANLKVENITKTIQYFAQ